MLRVAHRSIPGNPLLAEPLYLVEYIERMGTGTLDMIRRCAAAGLPEPEFSVTDGFVTTIRRLPQAARTTEQASQGSSTLTLRPESPPERPESPPKLLQERVLRLLASGPMSKAELAERLGHRTVSGQLNKVIRMLVKAGMIEFTVPGKPGSRLQRYRLPE